MHNQPLTEADYALLIDNSQLTIMHYALWIMNYELWIMH